MHVERRRACSTGNLPAFTGQVLDAETGLYYYRARYYSSAVGRFLQTDPVGYSADLNLYTYVGNDPVDRTDPTGRYDVTPCASNDTACSGAQGDFEQQRQNDLASSHSDVVAGAKAWGTPNDHNGVTVTFKSQSDENAEAGAPPGQNVNSNTVPSVQGDKATAQVSISTADRGTELARTVAHEGTHIGDAQKFAKTFDPKTGKYSGKANYTHRDTETRAYGAGQHVAPYQGVRNESDIQRIITNSYKNPDSMVWPDTITEPEP